jgi:hypothetical protein
VARVLLEWFINGFVFAKNIIPNFGAKHGFKHSRGGFCNSITAQINNHDIKCVKNALFVFSIIMRSILIILFFMLMIVSAKSYAQRWSPGRVTDVKGNVETGFIRFGAPGKGPIRDEGFIEFKKDLKSDQSIFTASYLKSFVIGRDSFVVAHAPGNEAWGENELDFVSVVLDEDVKLYAGAGIQEEGGSGSGFSLDVGIGTGIGTAIGRNAFASVGGGIDVPIIGGGSRGRYAGPVYYYGENTASMKQLTAQNFEDVMSDIMGDYPDVVDKIRAKVYGPGNLDKLIAYFEKVKGEKVKGDR